MSSSCRMQYYWCLFISALSNLMISGGCFYGNKKGVNAVKVRRLMLKLGVINLIDF